MYWPKNFGVKKEPKEKKVKFLFKVGDKVRISHLRSAFQREYDIKWSGEILKVSKRFVRQGQPIYRIIDWLNKPVKGTFYQKELQKVNVTDADVFKVDKILKYKGPGKNKLAKTRWLNWPKKFDSWVPVSELQKKIMQAVYLSTNGDTTTILSTPLEVQGYGCRVIELNGKVLVPKKLL